MKYKISWKVGLTWNVLYTFYQVTVQSEIMIYKRTRHPWVRSQDPLPKSSHLPFFQKFKYVFTFFLLTHTWTSCQVVWLKRVSRHLLTVCQKLQTTLDFYTVNEKSTEEEKIMIITWLQLFYIFFVFCFI